MMHKRCQAVLPTGKCIDQSRPFPVASTTLHSTHIRRDNPCAPGLPPPPSSPRRDPLMSDDDDVYEFVYEDDSDSNESSPDDVENEYVVNCSPYESLFLLDLSVYIAALC